MATISKVFRQNDAPAVTEPVNSIWYDTNDSNKSYVLVAGTPRVWTYTVDATLATSASVTQVSDTAADINGNLSASHSLMVNAGGAIAGMKVSASTSDTGVSNSNVVFLADQFTIKTASGTKQPFTVSNDVVSIDGTLKIGGSTASSIVTKANSATQASDHSTIQAGTTAANVGLANVVNSNFDASGNVIGGAVGGVTINSTKIFQGTGTFGNANTGFYLDNGGNFSLRNKLVFNGSTGDLSIAGAITATSGSIANGVLIGGTAASTVESKANASTTATAAATAANSASKNAGAIGPVSITSTALQQGSGGYGNANAGFYMDSSGQFSLRDKLTVDSSGNLSIAGAISATSGSIADGVTIGGTAASTVKTGAASGATANQTSNADIRAVGAATSGTIAGIKINGSAIYNGVGTPGNTNTGFYLGSNGTFYLKDKLSWDGTTLTVNGGGTFSGALSAASGTFAGALSAATGSFSGSLSAASGTFAGSLSAATGTFSGSLSAAAGTFSGSISAATGTFAGVTINSSGITGSGFTLNASGLQLNNASSVINIGNSVVISSDGLVGQGFELTSTGIEASSGLIGGWSIGSNLSSSDGEMTINPTTNSIQISEGTTVRVDINSSTTVSDPEQTGSINSGSSGLTTTTTTPSNQSGNISYSSGKNVFIYSSDTAQWSDSTAGIRNKTVQYNISMSANGYTINVTDGSGDFVGTMSCTAGLAFSTSTSSSNIFHYTSSATASRSGGGSASISNTTVSGTFVWPNQNTVYVIGWNKNVSVSGTNYSGEPPSGPQTSTISFRTPVTTLGNSNITLTISKCELVSGGLLVAKNTSNFLRVNRNVSSSNAWSSNFIHTKMYAWRHEGRLSVFDGTGSGDLVIGKSSPNVSGDYLRLHSTTSHKYIDYQGGNLIFRAGASTKGTLTSSGVWSTSGGGTSDFRKKQNIEYISSNVTEAIKQLRPVKFEFKDYPEKQRRGFIAQDVLGVMPDLVLGDGDVEGGTYGLDYDGILALVVKGFKEQQTIIESQKTLIDNLTERVTALEG